MSFKLFLLNGKRILSRRQTNILSAALVLGVTFTVSAVLGILRDRFLYAKFYSCCPSQLDAYNAAFRIPDIIFRLLVIGALSAAFIPIFSDYFNRRPKLAYQLAQTLMTLLFLVFFIISLLVFIFARPLSRLIVAGFSFNQVSLMASLTRLMLLAQLFFLMSNFLTGILQVQGRFLVPALAPVVYNLGIIFGIQALSPLMGIFGPALGVIIGSFLHFLIQFPLARSLGFRIRLAFNFRFSGVKKIIRLTIPRTLSLGLGEIESTVVLFLASTLPAGSLSLLYLAQHLGQLPARLFGATIGQAALPSLATLYSLKKRREFTDTLVDSLLQALFLAIPVAVATLVLRVPLIRLAFGAKQFPWRATLKTGKVLAFLAPAIVTQSGIQILTRGFYSLQDTRTPFLTAVISLLVVVGVSSWGVYRTDWGILSLVGAISLATFFQLLTLLFLLSRKIEDFPWLRLISFLKKTGLAAFLAAVCFWLSMHFLDYYLDTSRVWGLALLTLVSLILGMSVYLLVAIFLKVSQVKDYWLLLKKAVSWKTMFISSGNQIGKQKELLEPPATF